MSFHRYPAYKPSGVEWLGDVPEHWNALPLRRLIRQVTSGTSVNAIDEPASHGQAGVLKTSCVYTGEFRPEENKAILESELDRATCPVVAGTLVVSRMNTPDLVGAAGLVKNNEPYLFLPDRLWLVSFQDCDPQFMNYWCKSVSYRSQVQLACSGTSSSMQNLSQDNFYSFIAPLPPTGEQSAIASFLDRETAKIDALIAEQQRLIELLQEKRQSVISHAVTKGLNPNAPMKDSGVEWLGEVPEHWEIMGLAKTTLLLQTGPFGSQLGTADYKGEGVAVINPSNISEGSIDTSCGPFIAMNKALELERHKLYKGDLVIARRGEMGRCAVVKDGKEEKLCGTGSILVRPLDWMCTDFMAHIIRSEYSRASLSLNSVGSTMENLSAAIVGKLRIPVPPREEQVQIVDWIRSIASSYQCLANNSVRAIELLQERRSALISAAVTGQIDVRELAETETDKR